MYACGSPDWCPRGGYLWRRHMGAPSQDCASACSVGRAPPAPAGRQARHATGAASSGAAGSGEACCSPRATLRISSRVAQHCQRVLPLTYRSPGEDHSQKKGGAGSRGRYRTRRCDAPLAWLGSRLISEELRGGRLPLRRLRSNQGDGRRDNKCPTQVQPASFTIGSNSSGPLLC